MKKGKRLALLLAAVLMLVGAFGVTAFAFEYVEDEGHGTWTSFTADPGYNVAFICKAESPKHSINVKWPDKMEYTYGETIPDLKANVRFFQLKEGDSYDEVIQEISLIYLVDGKWVSTPPTKAGIYNVSLSKAAIKNAFGNIGLDAKKYIRGTLTVKPNHAEGDHTWKVTGTSENEKHIACTKCGEEHDLFISIKDADDEGNVAYKEDGFGISDIIITTDPDEEGDATSEFPSALSLDNAAFYEEDSTKALSEIKSVGSYTAKVDLYNNDQKKGSLEVDFDIYCDDHNWQIDFVKNEDNENHVSAHVYCQNEGCEFGKDDEKDFYVSLDVDDTDDLIYSKAAHIVQVNGIPEEFEDEFEWGWNNWGDKIISYEGLNGATLNEGSAVAAGEYKASTVFNVKGVKNSKNQISNTFTVSPKKVTPSEEIKAKEKGYDGKTTAKVTIPEVDPLTGVLEDDKVGVELLKASFADKNVGINKSVSYTLKLTGNDAPNYYLVKKTDKETGETSFVDEAEFTSEAAINKRPVFVKDLVAEKMYDGTTTAVITTNNAKIYHSTREVPFTDDEGNKDEVSVESAAGVYDTATVGTEKVVHITEATLGGKDAKNYYVLIGEHNKNDINDALITKKELTVTAKAKTSKFEYGYKKSDEDFDYDLSGFIDGESAENVMIEGSVTYNIKDSKGGDYKVGSPVGEYTVVPDVTQLTTDNYSFAPANGAFTLEPRTAEFTWLIDGVEINAEKSPNYTTYNGEEQEVTAEVKNTVTPEGEAAADVVKTHLSGDKSKINHSKSGYTVKVDDLDNDNYRLPTADKDKRLDWNIDKAALTVTAANQNIRYGEEADNVGLSYSGAVSRDMTGDDLNSGVIRGKFGTKIYNSKDSEKKEYKVGDDATEAGTTEYVIEVTKGTAAADNYDFIFVNGVLTVDKRVVKFRWNDFESPHVYDGTAVTAIATTRDIIPSDKDLVYVDYVNSDENLVTNSAVTVGDTKTIYAVIANKVVGNDKAKNYTYDDDSKREKTLTITPRPVELSWNPTTVYTDELKFPEPTITNLVTKAEATTADDCSIATTEVKDASGAVIANKDDLKNGSYTIEAKALTGTDAGNYTLVGGTKVTENFTVTTKSSGGGGGSVTDPVDEVIKMIKALDSTASDYAAKAQAAVDAYNALTDAQKADPKFKEQEVATKLADAQAAVASEADKKAADEASALIVKLPDDPSQASEADAQAAWAAYNALTDAQKALLSADAQKKVAEYKYYYEVQGAKAQTVKLKSVKAKKGRKAVAKWSKNADVDGYQLYYKAKGQKAKKVTIKSAKTLKKTVKKLKAGKKYTFKVRTFTKVYNPSTGADQKIYGKWSNKKTCKAKK